MRRTEDVEPRARTRGLDRIVGGQAVSELGGLASDDVERIASRRSFGRTEEFEYSAELLCLLIGIAGELQLAEAEAKRSERLCLLRLQLCRERIRSHPRSSRARPRRP